MIANCDSIETSERFSRQAPGERDLQIYAAVRVDGRRQVEVAAEFGISQGRVSQIVRRVNRWRVGMGIEADLEHRDRRSVDRWLEQLRIEKLYEETMELYRRSQEPRRRERTVTGKSGQTRTETIDHQPGNLQCLKLAGRLIELRRQLDENPPRPDQSMDSPRSRIDEYEAFRLLVDMRRDAVLRGDVPEEDDSEFLVRRMMRELTGEKPHISPGERAAKEAREAEVNAAAACLMDPPRAAANEPAIINDISADPAADEPADEASLLAANDCPATTSDEAADAHSTSAEPDAEAIPHAAKSETSENCWKLWVMSDVSAARWVVES